MKVVLLIILGFLVVICIRFFTIKTKFSLKFCIVPFSRGIFLIQARLPEAIFIKNVVISSSKKHETVTLEHTTEPPVRHLVLKSSSRAKGALPVGRQSSNRSSHWSFLRQAQTSHASVIYFCVLLTRPPGDN